MVVLKSQSRLIDKPLLTTVICLVLFGLLAVFNASVAIGLRDFNNKFYFLRSQLVWAGIGMTLMLVASQINYEVFLRFSPLILLAALVFLVVVLLPNFGIKALGAKRWLELGPISFQPAEFAKLAFVIYLASFLAKKKDFWRFVSILGVFVLLIIAEPDLGTAVAVASIGMVLYFVAGASVLEAFFLGVLGVLGVLGAIFSSAYRKRRLLSLFNPLTDPLGSSYHIRQALIAIGSGGFWGLGLGQSRQKFEYLPEVTTDSIFAVICEELGFLGAVVLIALFLIVLVRIFKIAKACPEERGTLLAVGVGSWLGVQTLVNLGAMVALLPLTGVPLPFISYGGSSLIVSLVAVGIVLNISKHKTVRK